MSSTLRELRRKILLPINRLYASIRLKEYHSRPRTLEEIVHWGMHFGGSGYMRIRSQQIPYEILSLAQAVQAIKPEVILEIGTATGGTLLMWAALAKNRVITCDLKEMKYQSGLYRQLPPPGSNCEVITLSGDSHSAEFKTLVAKTLGKDRVDFLFIDGDHTEKGVEADFRDYLEFVRPGGVVAFHDIVEKQPVETNQVFHLWKRIKNEYEHEEFVSDKEQCGFGIGIIRIP